MVKQTLLWSAHVSWAVTVSRSGADLNPRRRVPLDPGRGRGPDGLAGHRHGHHPGPWIAEVQAKKVAAQAEIRAATGQRRMSREEIEAVVTAFVDLARVVQGADPADKAIYTTNSS